ncbi:3-dehydroquinate synthase [Phytomonospora endophytica]|uniref:3-dehydroquinate synthase n=1 Tax=Phytomonospora endophytica TaxID=714109 RepID=UPI0035713719
MVDELLAHVGERPVRIPFGGAADYDAVIGRDLWSHVPEYLTGAAQAAILHTAPLAERAAALAVAVADAGVRPLLTEVPDAEAAKSVEVAAACWDHLGAAGFTRTDVVIGLGGGAVTDLAGFVAAAWLRGVRVIHLPTSLLGMVDAAIGGKTGVNVAAGKNLVGAFHPPAVVLCDLSTLESLPSADLAAGLAEVVKCGFIADAEILRRVEADPKAALVADSALLADIAARAIRVKAEVVTEDLRESGRRAFLNYGHTFAHAIEKVENYRWRHGDAVAVGMVFAAHLGRLTGRVDVVGRTVAILESLGLPTHYEAGKFDGLLAAMRVDKKSVGATMRFVLLDAIGRPALVDDVTEEQLRTAYAEVSA